MLPSPGVETQIGRAGLTLRGMVGCARDYARTLRAWNARFQAVWPEIERMGFDRRFRRIWEQHLACCAAGFTTGRIDVKQFAIARG
jgi:cyclopropane-fatty-acyl-phospholipid synthase